MREDRPSSTARLIARATLLAAQEPLLAALVPVGASEAITLVLAEDGRAAWFDYVLRHRWAARVTWVAERLILPGIVCHYLARKLWIERQVLAALHQGCAQVVILGAGFDTLAWRLHPSWPEVAFFELDHPATQQPKIRGLIGLGVSRSQENLHLLPVDLSRQLPLAGLKGHSGFQISRRTCFVAEGLLMYFPPIRVAELLRDLAAVPATKIVFSFMEPDPDGRASFRGNSRLIDAWLKLKNEPFAWTCSREELPAFLNASDWRFSCRVGADELRTEILAPAGIHDAALAEGECLATATTK